MTPGLLSGVSVRTLMSYVWAGAKAAEARMEPVNIPNLASFMGSPWVKRERNRELEAAGTCIGVFIDGLGVGFEKGLHTLDGGASFGRQRLLLVSRIDRSLINDFLRAV